ncbi:DUF2147 domain-containing protein [Segetibacter koreensis]|uniref:DUF2147 domain-containing protein n=1 Tax=Segetibacter koreensis TaxID=398037 RepID=UPI000378DFF0|nr:DUF2147 domain-containing protein [Segetibacter koreensis]
MKKIAFLFIFVFSAYQLFAAFNADAILGVWANSTNKGHIQIYKNNGKYYGKIIWLKHPYDKTGSPKVDFKNPDENVRNNKLLGLIMLRDFIFDNEEWKGGKIYNPQDGKEYKSSIKLTDQKTMSVRGYIGFSFFGKTEKFIRVR